MSASLFMVFFDPDDAVKWPEFDEYSNFHIADDMLVPGYLAVRRYRLDLGHGSEFPSTYKYVTVYEVDKPLPELLAGTRAQADRGERRVHPSPEWYQQHVTWAMRTGEPLSGGPDPTARDRLYFVFSSVPKDMASFEEYSTWYDQHQKENIAASELLKAGWRYRVEGGAGIGADTDGPPAHLALYELTGDPKVMLEQTHAAVASGATSMIDTFHSLASLEATAIGPRLTAKS